MISIKVFLSCLLCFNFCRGHNYGTNVLFNFPVLPEVRVPGEPFVSLEHINYNTGPWSELLEKFYFDVMGFSKYPLTEPIVKRTRDAGGTMAGLIWASIGLQQFHFPLDESQVVRGVIGLSYPSIYALKSKLDLNHFEYQIINDNNQTVLEVNCPEGNRLRIHEQYSDEKTWFGPKQVIAPTQYYENVNLQNNSEHSVTSGCKALPGGPSAGLGMAYVQFDVHPNSASKIAQFYRTYFGAKVQLLEVENDPLNSAAPAVVNKTRSSCSTTSRANTQCHSSRNNNSYHSNIILDQGSLEEGPIPSRRWSCIIQIGFHQQLIFTEISSHQTISKYDGHHIAVYVNNFIPLYRLMKSKGLTWNNPRFPQFTSDTEERTLSCNEFRIKHIIDPDSNLVVYELEHEIRSLAHPGYSCK